MVGFTLSYEDALVDKKVCNLKAFIYTHIVNAKVWRPAENCGANEV